MVMMKRKNLLGALGIHAFRASSGSTVMVYDDGVGLVFDAIDRPDGFYEGTPGFMPASECPAFIRRSPYVGVI